MNNISLYNDNTQVFLHSVLREIPYLSECSRDTISALAMSMKQDFLEPGSAYFLDGDTQECLSIIQDGVIEIRTTMDNGTPIVIEKLERGAILGAYLFLVADENKVNAICVN